jgi:hypothetical protein
LTSKKGAGTNQSECRAGVPRFDTVQFAQKTFVNIAHLFRELQYTMIAKLQKYMFAGLTSLAFRCFQPEKHLTSLAFRCFQPEKHFHFRANGLYRGHSAGEVGRGESRRGPLSGLSTQAAEGKCLQIQTGAYVCFPTFEPVLVMKNKLNSISTCEQAVSTEIISQQGLVWRASGVLSQK